MPERSLCAASVTKLFNELVIGFPRVDRDGQTRSPRRWIMSRRGNVLVRRYLWKAALNLAALDLNARESLIHTYCSFSGVGAACEAAAPAGGLVSGSARNLPIICGTSAEVMEL